MKKVTFTKIMIDVVNHKNKEFQVCLEDMQKEGTFDYFVLQIKRGCLSVSKEDLELLNIHL